MASNSVAPSRTVHLIKNGMHIMPRVADYDVVTDEPTTLGAGAGQTPRADLPLGFSQEIVLGARSVLSYMVDPDSSGMTFKMSIVTTNIDASPVVVSVVPSTTLPDQTGHVRQEVIAGGVLSTINSVLRIQVTSGSGKFSDIVLWHQSDV
ncbi:MAG: hypothetical protein H0W96_17265 [Solirubrobacterales bacterium]|nr:hypothetical protein [Solirubrobacterales bacterium]